MFLTGLLFREGDELALRAASGRTTAPTRRSAFERLVDLLTARLAEFPDMHVYHYSAAEPSLVKQLMAQHATREAEVDDLLRRGVFVDLLTITRQALRAGVRRYTLKQTERLAGFVRAADMGCRLRGRTGLRAVGRQPATRPSSTPSRPTTRRIASRRVALRDWLLAVRPPGITGPAPIASVVPDEEDAEDATERARLRLALTDGEPQGSARRLAGELLEYHRREDRPVWWRHFACREMDESELMADSETLAGLEPAGGPRDATTRSHEYDLRFPAQEHKIEPGSWVDPATGKGVNVCSVDDEQRLVVIRRLKESLERPAAASAHARRADRDEGAARGALAARLGRPRRRWPFPGAAGPARQRAAPVRGRARGCFDPDHRSRGGPAARALARREHPRRPGAARHRQDLARRAADRRPDRERQAGGRHGDESQGDPQPAGRGRARGERGRRSASRARASAGPADEPMPEHWRTQCVGDSAGCFDAEYQLVAGTSWLFAPDFADEQLDYLVIDEAGQLSLADALASGTAARNLILLGDPLQLRARLAGRAPRRHKPERAAAPARRAPDRACRARAVSRADASHAPGRVRVHLGRGLREPPHVAPGLRAPERRRRGRHPLPAGSPTSATRPTRPRRRA